MQQPDIGANAIRLETHERWDEILAATEERSVVEVAEAYGVPPGALRSALRRTGKKGGRRRIVRPPGAPEETAPPAVARARAPARSAGNQGARRPPRRRQKSDALLEPYRDRLGTVPDHEIAAAAGTTKWVVRGYRVRLGIEPYDRWGTERERGASTQGRRPAVRRTAKTKETAAPMPEPGTTRTPPTPAPKARSRGKARASSTDLPDRRRRATPGRDRVAAHHHLVGVVPDHVVAARAGVSVGTLKNYRREHGIPGAPRSAWASATRKPAAEARPAARTTQPRRAPPRNQASPAPEKAPMAAAPTRVEAQPAPVQETTPRTSYAWRVTLFGDEERLAVANDIVQLGEKLHAAGLEDVMRVERLGVALVG